MTRVVINFPFSGYEKGDTREGLFWQIVGTCRKTGAEPVVVVINEDTIAREGGRYTDAFLTDPRVAANDVLVHRTWAVDTCQMWLAGWGVALGMLPYTGRAGDWCRTLPEPGRDERMVLLPGDVDQVGDPEKFFAERLPRFLAATRLSDLAPLPEDTPDRPLDIVVGHFETGKKLANKDLIDLYGTYPMLALWFPEVAHATRDKTIWKPRSEFLNVRAGVLRELLRKRKFAYEQTLNMLIHAWDFAKHTWRYQVDACSLGVFEDDPNSRNLAGAIDQIERTERLLKMVWRECQFSAAADAAEAGANEAVTLRGLEYSKPAYAEEYGRILAEKSQEILKRYDELEATSRAIEATARITVLSFIAR